MYALPILDEPLNRDLLAAIAGFSVPHFHRIFTAHVGETISQYVRRVRMERAARRLFNPAIQVTDNLWQTWQSIYRDWLPASGHELRDALCFEDYVDDPSEVAAEELRTDIYVPIR